MLKNSEMLLVEMPSRDHTLAIIAVKFSSIFLFLFFFVVCCIARR